MGPPSPLFLHLDVSRLVLWGLHPWKGCLETDGHISAVGQVLEVVGSFSLPTPFPLSLYSFFPPSIHTIAALVDVLKANQGASNEETEEITCGPAVRTWRFHS